MANSNEFGGAGLLVPFLAGAVAAAAVALLFAPASGDETRRNFGDRARDRARERYAVARGEKAEPV